MFGLIFSRMGIQESGEVHLKDIWQHENKMLVVLDDQDVEQMLLNRKAGQEPCRIVMEKIQEFRQKL